MGWFLPEVTGKSLLMVKEQSQKPLFGPVHFSAGSTNADVLSLNLTNAFGPAVTYTFCPKTAQILTAPPLKCPLGKSVVPGLGASSAPVV